MKQPYWPGTLYRAHLDPAAKAAGIPGKIGWHTFRHTFATLLKANGEDIKTVQELLRHANISVTMNVYAQGVNGYENLIPAMTNHPKDRHVLAAAVRAVRKQSSLTTSRISRILH